MSELKKCVETSALSPEYPYMPKEEWEGRIKKARVLMDKNGIDGLVILNEWSRTYYFGFEKLALPGFPMVAIVPKEGPTTFIALSFIAAVLQLSGYSERVVNLPFALPPLPNAPDGVSVVAEVIMDMGLDKKKLGVEMGIFGWNTGLTLGEWERLKSLLPKVKWVDSMNSVIWPQRKIKTQWEQDVLTKLYNATCKGYFKGIEFAGPGVNEADVFKEMLKVWIAEGIVESITALNAPNVARKISVGKYMDHILKKGDCIFIDAGPTYKNYATDCQRIVWIGDPGPKAREWAYAAEIAHSELESIIKPGTKYGDIWQKGHEVFARYLAKYFDDYWKMVRSPYWLNIVGHCVGFGVQEPPYIQENSPEILEPGMVVNVEFPALDLEKGIIYNMPEDTYIITEDGFKCLTFGLGPKGIYIKE